MSQSIPVVRNFRRACQGNSNDFARRTSLPLGTEEGGSWRGAKQFSSADILGAYLVAHPPRNQPRPRKTEASEVERAS